MALRIYRSPQGFTFQFEEGEQPEGFEPITPDKPKAAPRKRRTTANKSRSAANKTQQ